MFISINGVQHDLWRAVDQDGHVRDILVQARRDKAAAVQSLRTLLQGLAYVPRVVITDNAPATARQCARSYRGYCHVKS